MTEGFREIVDLMNERLDMEKGPLTIKITVSHCRGGEGNDVEVGTILRAPGDLSIQKARELIGMNYAIEVKPAGGDQPAAAGDTIETRDPKPGHRDPAGAAGDTKAPQGRKKTRGRKKKND
jgi:hypothetical protein